ncbi:MAG: Fic family protein, partial [Burkholderiaceae bacterium]
ADRPLNERQRKVIQRMLDAGPSAFAGGISADKYGNLTRVSKATATRDLSDLLQHQWVFAAGQGKATRYHLNVPEWREKKPAG